ncbi:MAG: biliverdin-producing heme oxygenase [Terricaulis sp.]
MYDTSLTLRQRLKLATGPAHVALEARIGTLDTQPAYNLYARGLHAFRSAVEGWLSAQELPAIGVWRPQSIALALHDDLSDLTLTPLDAFTLQWDATASGSFVMGVHYVLEGSALGARVLCKQVAALGLTRDHGARHLWAQADTPTSWRGYLHALENIDIDEAALIAGADAAFVAAAGAMERAADV